MPKATLFEPVRFRTFVAKSLLTKIYGESVARGPTESKKDSNFVLRRPILRPSHHGPHDAHHLADPLGTIALTHRSG